MAATVPPGLCVYEPQRAGEEGEAALSAASQGERGTEEC